MQFRVYVFFFFPSFLFCVICFFLPLFCTSFYVAYLPFSIYIFLTSSFRVFHFPLSLLLYPISRFFLSFYLSVSLVFVSLLLSLSYSLLPFFLAVFPTISCFCIYSCDIFCTYFMGCHRSAPCWVCSRKHGSVISSTTLNIRGDPFRYCVFHLNCALKSSSLFQAVFLLLFAYFV